MGRRFVVARRDLDAISREKTIVLALLIQLFVAAFSSFLVVGLSTLYDPTSIESEATIDVGVTGDSEELLAVAQEQPGLRARAYRSTSNAMADFRERRLDAVLQVHRTDGGVLEVDATVAEGFRTTLVVVQLRQALETLERTERTERRGQLDAEVVPLPDDGTASPYFGFTYTILLPLLLFLPAFISGSLAVDVITEEIERGTLTMLRVTPASLTEIVDGKAGAMAALAPAQAALWIALLWFNGIAVANVPALLVFVAALALAVVTLGVVMGLATAERQRAQLLYSMAILVLFGGAAVLPEHPANTAALLAIDSATTTTWTLLAGYVALAVGGYALAREYANRVDPEAF